MYVPVDPQELSKGYILKIEPVAFDKLTDEQKKHLQLINPKNPAEGYVRRAPGRNSLTQDADLAYFAAQTTRNEIAKKSIEDVLSQLYSSDFGGSRVGFTNEDVLSAMNKHENTYIGILEAGKHLMEELKQSITGWYSNNVDKPLPLNLNHTVSNITHFIPTEENVKTLSFPEGVSKEEGAQVLRQRIFSVLGVPHADNIAHKLVEELRSARGKESVEKIIPTSIADVSLEISIIQTIKDKVYQESKPQFKLLYRTNQPKQK